MSKWLKEMQDKADRENLAAIRAEFDRCVAEEGMADSKESWTAFIHGWFGTRRFSAAKQELQHAGESNYMLTVVCWLFGPLIITGVAMAYFTVPSENLALHRLSWAIAISVGLIAAGFLSLRRFRRVYAEALEAHRAKWGDPENERSN